MTFRTSNKSTASTCVTGLKYIMQISFCHHIWLNFGKATENYSSSIQFIPISLVKHHSAVHSTVLPLRFLKHIIYSPSSQWCTKVTCCLEQRYPQRWSTSGSTMEILPHRWNLPATAWPLAGLHSKVEPATHAIQGGKKNDYLWVPKGMNMANYNWSVQTQIFKLNCIFHHTISFLAELSFYGSLPKGNSTSSSVILPGDKQCQAEPRSLQKFFLPFFWFQSPQSSCQN